MKRWHQSRFILPVLFIYFYCSALTATAAAMTMMKMVGVVGHNNVAAASVVENFRPVAGTTRLYRCASTDGLAQVSGRRFITTEDEEDYDDARSSSSSSSGSSSSVSAASPNTLSTTATTGGTNTAESILLRRACLIIDLRSAMERDETQATVWMNQHGFRVVDAKDDIETNTDDESSSSIGGTNNNNNHKTVLRIDVQPRDRILDYLTRHWLTPAQKVANALYTVVDANKQHELRMDTLNEKGLPGLYEAILETGGADLCLTLRRITEHLERTTTTTTTTTFDESISPVVVFHCVKGKDRTGIVAMLCQSILGLSEEQIIHEYALSEQFLLGVYEEKSTVPIPGRFDKQRFAGSPPQVMRDTLTLVRSRYGSVNPGYLDHIGFDRTWRDRFVLVQAACEEPTTTAPSRTQRQQRLAATTTSPPSTVVAVGSKL
jgi:hypothetical protein